MLARGLALLAWLIREIRPRGSDSELEEGPDFAKGLGLDVELRKWLGRGAALWLVVRWYLSVQCCE